MRKLEPGQPDDENVLPMKERGDFMSRTPRGRWFPACAGKTEGFLGLVYEVRDGFQSRNRSEIFSESVCQTSAIIRDSKILTVQAVSSANRQETFRCKSLNRLDLQTADDSDDIDGLFFFKATKRVRQFRASKIPNKKPPT